MRTKQTILFILAIVFTIGFFMPLLTMKAHIPMSTIFGDGVQEDFNLTMSAFNLLTDNNKVRFNSIFIISLIIVPILITIIAITQKYKWLFTVSLPLLLFIFSMIYCNHPTIPYCGGFQT